jgi:drug/metabolite transporter (DMT)-like permease
MEQPRMTRLSQIADLEAPRLPKPVAAIAHGRSQRRAWIAWSAVCFFWGTTYLGIKIGLETIPPFLLGGARYTLAGVVLIVLIKARRRSLPAFSEWSFLAVLGFFMIVLGNGGVVWGEQFVPSGLTAVVLGTSPFWMVSVNALMPGGERLHARQWLGLVIGFAGIVFLVWPEISLAGGGRQFILGVVALEIACAGWAVGANLTRRHVLPRDVLGAAALQMLFGGLMMLTIGTTAGEWSRAAITPRTFTAWLYLAIFGSVVGYAAFSYALQHLPVAIVSLHNFINPVIAVALGSLVLGEPFHSRMLVAGVVIVIGILVVGPPVARRT